MKSGLTLIAAIILLGFPFRSTRAANLINTRTGEHQAFTRIVFEFQGVVRSKAPIITGRGKFYIVFPDSRTALPRKKLNQTTKGVRFIKLTQKESHLIANIRLSFPYFRLKTFLLSNPERIVIDAYRMSSPPEEIVFKESSHAEPLASILTEPATRDRTTHTQRRSTKAISSQSERNAQILKKGSLDRIREQGEGVSEKIVKQIPATSEAQGVSAQKVIQSAAKQKKLPLSLSGNYHIQIYVLAILIVFTLIIFVLLSLNLLKKRSRIDSDHLSEILGFLKTTDERIATIDEMIQKELKSLNHS